MNRRSILTSGMKALGAIGLAGLFKSIPASVVTNSPAPSQGMITDRPGFILRVTDSGGNYFRPDGFHQRRRLSAPVIAELIAPDGESISRLVSRKSIGALTPEMQKWKASKERAFYQKPRRNFWRIAA